MSDERARTRREGRSVRERGTREGGRKGRKRKIGNGALAESFIFAGMYYVVGVCICRAVSVNKLANRETNCKNRREVCF